MNIKFDAKAVPIDLLRTFVVRMGADTLLDAERQLGRTRHAIDADIRRLQVMLGFDLFVEPSPEPRLTKAGSAVLIYAQRMTSMNDELMRLMSKTPPTRRFRIGMPQWMPQRYLIDVIKSCSSACEAVSFRCDELETMMRDLESGLLDLAFLCNMPAAPGVAVAEWNEPLYWIKSPDLQLRAGESVGLVSWPGGVSNRVSTELLEAAGIDYSIVFSSRTPSARIAAVAAGLGLMLGNERVLVPEVCVARERYLPKPPKIRTGIYRREGLDIDAYAPVLDAFVATMAPRGLPPAAVENVWR